MHTQPEKCHLPLPTPEIFDITTLKLRGSKIYVGKTVLEKIPSVQLLQSHLKNTQGTSWTACFPKGAASMWKAWGSTVFPNHASPTLQKRVVAKAIRAHFPPDTLTHSLLTSENKPATAEWHYWSMRTANGPHLIWAPTDTLD